MQSKLCTWLGVSLVSLLISVGGCGGGKAGGSRVESAASSSASAALPAPVSWKRRAPTAAMWPDAAKRVQIVIKPSRYRGAAFAYVYTEGNRLSFRYCIPELDVPRLASLAFARAAKLAANPRIAVWFESHRGATALLPAPHPLLARGGGGGGDEDEDEDDTGTTGNAPGDDCDGIIVKETKDGGGPTVPSPEEMLNKAKAINVLQQ